MSRRIKKNPMTAESGSEMLSTSLYLYYYNMLKNMTISMFEWKGLPETFDTRFLEKTLFDYGQASFVDDSTLGKINTKCVPSGNLNHYDMPISFNAYSTNYNQTYDFDADNFIYVRNNALVIPTSQAISMFAQKLYECDMAISSNVAQQKFSVVLECEETERLTMENVIQKFMGFVPFIYSRKSYDFNSKANVMNFNIPFIVDKLYIHKEKVMSECLTFLGLNNVSTEKKERLITDEVNANNEVIDYNANTMLKYRRLACEEMNKKWGTNATVDYVLTSEDYEMLKDGEENGNLYDDFATDN